MAQRYPHLPQRPPYPQTTSQASAASTSSTRSLDSLSTFDSLSRTPSMPASSAPLPSPSAGQPTAYFGSISTQQIPRSSHPAQQPASAGFIGQRANGGGLPETAPFIKDLSLVAEAAKRAQMACLARDLGDVGL